jgi:hypothetical protein
MSHRFTNLDLPKDGFGTPDKMDLSTPDHQGELPYLMEKRFAKTFLNVPKNDIKIHFPVMMNSKR